MALSKFIYVCAHFIKNEGIRNLPYAFVFINQRSLIFVLREKLLYKFFRSCASFFYGIQKSADIFLLFYLQQFFLFRLKLLNLCFDIRDLFFNGLT